MLPIGYFSQFIKLFSLASKEQRNEAESAIVQITMILKPAEVQMISILLIDDDKTVTQLGTAILEIQGYHVISILESLKALALFKKQPNLFDLVITDYMMPSMKGDELTAEIRAIRTDIPILLCTGYSDISESMLQEWGMNAKLLKPYKCADLTEVVQQLLCKK